MSRASVRAGIAEFFGGPLIAGQDVYRGGPLQAYGLATVRAAQAKQIPDTDYTAGLPSGRAMGTVGVVHLGISTERRVALGGETGGWKHRVYQVTLHLYHLANTPTTEAVIADLDELLERVTARIHGDRTLGGTALQAGESSAGIKTFLGEPAISGTPERIRTYASVAFDADVYIKA
ncbi:hypothetical protein [Acrocarpospora catenulata]|uniref:hypothetical protein n=1 Tax=Acrocarpospora catenulata TaxID=2836182 RepID=UPI001BD9FB55|nr:hypothetical protein [Acrocarpospora catenulata]